MTINNISRFHHVAMTVRDGAKSAQWYHDVFGFELVQKFTRTWLVGRGSCNLGLTELPKGHRVKDLDAKIAIQHIAFHVEPDDFASAVRALSDLGIPFEGLMSPGSLALLYSSMTPIGTSWRSLPTKESPWGRHYEMAINLRQSRENYAWRDDMKHLFAISAGLFRVPRIGENSMFRNIGLAQSPNVVCCISFGSTVATKQEDHNGKKKIGQLRDIFVDLH